MSMATQTNDARQQRTGRRGNRAFIVEALVLFVFLVATLAIVTQLFFASANRAQRSLELERAVTIAANTAERFSANPLSRELDGSYDGLEASCRVTPQRMAAGTLYHALVTVRSGDEEVYRLETSRYVSEVS